MHTALFVLSMASATQGPLEVELRGEIRTLRTGPETRAVLVAGDDNHVLASRLPGLEEELLNLEGVTVLVVGNRDRHLRPRGVDLLVERYTILDVGDGRVPRVGHLASLKMPDGPRLLFVDDRGQADFLPDSWNKRMATKVGSKIWILGRRDDGAFVPTRFRILRAAEAP